MKLIAPSLLSADFSKLGEEIRAGEQAGADLLHVDIMDGHFVPNLTMGPPVVRSIRKISKLPLDCHLMIDNPMAYLEPFQKAGADWISVHVETCDLSQLLPAIQKLQCKAGAVLNPDTPISAIIPFLELADYLVIMTVEPGFGGQSLIPSALEKTAELKKILRQKKLEIPVQIDGGIKLDNFAAALRSQADIFVSGSGIFHTPDYHKTIQAMRAAILSFSAK